MASFFCKARSFGACWTRVIRQRRPYTISHIKFERLAAGGRDGAQN